MNITHRITALFVSVTILFLMSAAQAQTPLWSFTALTATTVSVPSNSTAIVQYRVTNQSAKPHTLTMKPIQGITQLAGSGLCSSVFALPTKNSSCILSLQINGNHLTTPIVGGPIVCQEGSALQCYRPSEADILQITIGAPLPVPTLTSITPSSGTASGNTGVTLTGTNLTDTTSVTLGGIAATSVNIVDSTTVTAVTPAHAAGTVDVIIATLAGNATLTNGYSYNATAVGQASGGGTIACLGGGLNNLIAATTNNSTSILWGGFGTITNAQSTTNGATNTSTIISVLGTNGGVPYAAKNCHDYAVDSQGNAPCQAGNTCYNDWFLPAANQLNCLYTNRVAIGNFITALYWSSSELTGGAAAFAATVQSFPNGSQGGNGKNSNAAIRCARSFTP